MLVEVHCALMILIPEVKAKAKDMPYCHWGTSKPRTWPRGLQHWC